MTDKKLKKKDIERLENTSIATPLLDNAAVDAAEDICAISDSCGVSDVCVHAVTESCTNDSTACVDAQATMCSGDGGTACNDQSTACNHDGTACNDSVTACGAVSDADFRAV